VSIIPLFWRAIKLLNIILPNMISIPLHFKFSPMNRPPSGSSCAALAFSDSPTRGE